MIDIPRPSNAAEEYEVSEMQSVLELHETLSLQELSALLRREVAATRAMLASWIAAGFVEELRPLSDRGSRCDEWVYVRWKGSRDTACLWQQRYFEGCASSRRNNIPAQP